MEDVDEVRRDEGFGKLPRSAVHETGGIGLRHRALPEDTEGEPIRIRVEQAIGPKVKKSMVQSSCRLVRARARVSGQRLPSSTKGSASTRVGLTKAMRSPRGGVLPVVELATGARDSATTARARRDRPAPCSPSP